MTYEIWRQDVFGFLVKAVVISLSGVMAPGPMTAATVAAGARRRHAGLLAALGHAVIEFPLMILIVVGVGKVFKYEGVQIAIGSAGGAFLLLLAVQMLLALRKSGGTSEVPAQRHPFWAGVILSGGNAYFLLWWATIGLALATQAAGLGILAFALFAVVHWLCDLLWLEALSLASFRGARLLGGRSQQIVLGLCAAAMLVFGCTFLYDAGAKLLAAGSAN